MPRVKHLADRIIDDFLNAGESVKKGITVEDVDPEELSAGIKVEAEHTRDKTFMAKISLDHLAEFPHYYTFLLAMESMMQRAAPVKLAEAFELMEKVVKAGRLNEFLAVMDQHMPIPRHRN